MGRVSGGDRGGIRGRGFVALGVAFEGGGEQAARLGGEGQLLGVSLSLAGAVALQLLPAGVRLAAGLRSVGSAGAGEFRRFLPVRREPLPRPQARIARRPCPVRISRTFC